MDKIAKTQEWMQILNAGEYTGEIIQKINIEDSVITNTLYSAKKSNPDWHYHENLHICFVFQGGRAETRHQTKYTEKDGSIFFYHAEERHRWISPQPVSKSANIEIGPQFLKIFDIESSKVKEAIQANVDAKALILKMQKEMLRNDATSEMALQSLLLEFLSRPAANRSKNIPRWVIRLTALLHDNWNEKMTLSQMAQVVQVHPITISKHFRKYFFCTMGEYRRQLKIEKSIDLIKNTNKSLSEIAFECNFSDQSHFIRNFKERTGFLPKDFRKL